MRIKPDKSGWKKLKRRRPGGASLREVMGVMLCCEEKVFVNYLLIAPDTHGLDLFTRPPLNPLLAKEGKLDFMLHLNLTA